MANMQQQLNQYLATAVELLQNPRGRVPCDAAGCYGMLNAAFLFSLVLPQLPYATRTIVQELCYQLYGKLCPPHTQQLFNEESCNLDVSTVGWVNKATWFTQNVHLSDRGCTLFKYFVFPLQEMLAVWYTHIDYQKQYSQLLHENALSEALQSLRQAKHDAALEEWCNDLSSFVIDHFIGSLTTSVNAHLNLDNMNAVINKLSRWLIEHDTQQQPFGLWVRKRQCCKRWFIQYLYMLFHIYFAQSHYCLQARDANQMNVVFLQYIHDYIIMDTAKHALILQYGRLDNDLVIEYLMVLIHLLSVRRSQPHLRNEALQSRISEVTALLPQLKPDTSRPLAQLHFTCVYAMLACVMDRFNNPPTAHCT